MAQTSREIVRKTLTFDNPERLPRHTWILPWAHSHYPAEIKELGQKYPDDIVTAPNVYQKSPVAKGDPYAIGSCVDEWGCEFENIQKGVIGEVKKAAVADAGDLSTLHVPYETLPADTDAARRTVNEFCASTDKFVLANCCPRPWERLQFLRGTVEAMMDIMTPEGGVKRLLAEIHKFYMAELEFWVTTDVDAVMFMDDWGSQNSLLIPPPLWVEFFKPLYKDYSDIAHKNGKFIFMHSDGHITAIYPHLVEIGIDALNSQLFCMDMAELAKIAKGKLTFWGEIDRQHILPSPNTQDARDAVRKVASHLYDPAGGIMAQFEITPGSNIKNVFAIYDEWEKVASSGH